MPSVVLIEDNQTDVFLVKQAIAAHHLDINLQVMEDGEQAIRFIAGLDADPSAQCPRLFLLDLNLPRISGLEVLSGLRHSKRCASLPVLVMTSSDAQTDRAQSAALGATGYFSKPSGYQEFLTIGEVIQAMLAA